MTARRAVSTRVSALWNAALPAHSFGLDQNACHARGHGWVHSKLGDQLAGQPSLHASGIQTSHARDTCTAQRMQLSTGSCCTSHSPNHPHAPIPAAAAPRTLWGHRRRRLPQTFQPRQHSQHRHLSPPPACPAPLHHHLRPRRRQGPHPLVPSASRKGPSETSSSAPASLSFRTGTGALAQGVPHRGRGRAKPLHDKGG